MSDRQLENWLDGYLEFVDNTEPPDIFKVWTGISVVAACLQRKCSVRIWETVFPNFYTVLIGPPGSRKGTALRIGRELLTILKVRLTSDATTPEAMIKALKRNTDSMMVDGKVEEANSSITVFASELAVFIGYNRPSFLSQLTDWYDCQSPWTYTTIGRGEEEIYGICVNLIGATTPGLLKSIFPQDAVGGGLTSRMIFVYGDKKSKVVSDLIVEDTKLKAKILLDLDKILMMRGEFKMSPEFQRLESEWYEDQEANPPFTDPNFYAYTDRRRLHMLKLCMVVSACRASDMILRKEDFARSLMLLKETEKNMHKTFAGYGRSELADMLPKVMGTIVMHGRITFQELMRMYYRDLSKDEMEKLISTIEATRFCKRVIADKKQFIEYIPKEET